MTKKDALHNGLPHNNRSNMYTVFSGENILSNHRYGLNADDKARKLAKRKRGIVFGVSKEGEVVYTCIVTPDGVMRDSDGIAKLL